MPAAYVLSRRCLFLSGLRVARVRIQVGVKYFIRCSVLVVKRFTMLLLTALAGIACWTLAEYLLHRFLGHEHKGHNFFKSEHVLHHSRANYFAPAYKKMLLALAVSTVLLAALSLLLPFAIALAFMVGFTAMYSLYEVTHHRYHSKQPLAAPFIALRKHHFYHHFHNPGKNHGVTTRFWDRVFGTYVPVETVTVPRKLSMQWLLAGEDIREEYQPHFRLAALQKTNKS